MTDSNENLGTAAEKFLSAKEKEERDRIIQAKIDEEKRRLKQMKKDAKADKKRAKENAKWEKDRQKQSIENEKHWAAIGRDVQKLIRDTIQKDPYIKDLNAAEKETIISALQQNETFCRELGRSYNSIQSDYKSEFGLSDFSDRNDRVGAMIYTGWIGCMISLIGGGLFLHIPLIEALVPGAACGAMSYDIGHNIHQLCKKIVNLPKKKSEIENTCCHAITQAVKALDRQNKEKLAQAAAAQPATDLNTKSASTDFGNAAKDTLGNPANPQDAAPAQNTLGTPVRRTHGPVLPKN